MFKANIPLIVSRPRFRFLAHPSGRMPGRGGWKNKSGGRKPGEAKVPLSREETVSRAMSYVLRHGAEREKLKLDEGGYINCMTLVSWSLSVYRASIGLNAAIRFACPLLSSSYPVFIFFISDSPI